MALSEGQRRIHNIVAEKSNRDVNIPVFDTVIVDASWSTNGSRAPLTYATGFSSS